MTTIAIDLGTRKLELTADEARAVHAALCALFNQVKEGPVMVPYPVYPYPTPYPLDPVNPWCPVYGSSSTGDPLPQPAIVTSKGGAS